MRALIVRKLPLAAAVVVLLASTAAWAQTTFTFDDPKGGNRVEFQSKAPVETFEGHTAGLTGSITLDPADVTGLTGQLVVDLASLETGLGLRDTHMREQVLHTDQYPQAILAVKGVQAKEGSTLRPGEPLSATLTGDLTLHGVTKPITADVAATWRPATAETAKRGPGDLLEVQAHFAVKLSEFGMERPKMLVMKVADEIKLTVKALATSVPRAEKATAPGN